MNNKGKQVFKSSLPGVVSSMIDTVFDGLMQFQTDWDSDRIIDHIDTKKGQIKDKKCEEYRLLSAVESVIDNMGEFSREPKLSETFHLRAFCNMLDPILRTTSLHIKEGEIVSSVTKRMQIINDVDVTYGLTNQHVVRASFINKLAFNVVPRVFSTQSLLFIYVIK
ncbi:hypothetical protein MBANPS3_009174 [Mucor bainieri]